MLPALNRLGWKTSPEADRDVPALGGTGHVHCGIAGGLFVRGGRRPIWFMNGMQPLLHYPCIKSGRRLMPLVALECPPGYDLWRKSSEGPVPGPHWSGKVCTNGSSGRCPKGTRKHADGVCRRGIPTQKTKKKKSPPRVGRPAKRCPRGSRRNKKTGKCETVRAVSIKTTISPEAARASLAVSAAVSSSRTSKTRRSRLRSFSPAVNRAIVSLRTSAKPGAQLGCGLEKLLDSKAPLPKASDKIIVVGTDKKSGRPICAALSSPEAKKVLLRNLQGAHKLNCANVTAPIQKEANCWFNAMFMCLFVSNKGRKFFRFFRQRMIEGRRHGAAVGRNLRYAFLLLNACISAACGEAVESHVGESVRALALDTNYVLERVHRGIPAAYRFDDVPGKSTPGNPISYYSAIMNYLGDGRLRLLRVKLPSAVKVLMANFKHSPPAVATYRPRPGQQRGFFKDWANPPDLIVVTRDTQEHDGRALPFVKVLNKFRVGEAEYEIDSAVVRDEGENHFCALITCGDKEMAFDGAAFTRLTPFKWKGILNKNVPWAFSAATPTQRLRWTFTSSYQELLYYRVK